MSTAPDAAGIEAALAAGLAAHRLTWRTSTLAVCTCGQWSGYDVAQGKLDAPVRRAHDTHAVAAALLPVVTQAQAEALREAADRWIEGAWADVMLPKPTPPALPVIAYANRMGDWLRARADESGA